MTAIATLWRRISSSLTAQQSLPAEFRQDPQWAWSVERPEVLWAFATLQR